MDNHDHQTDEEKERRNSNTEYMPTKCRITKPTPPKPATNPLQFIKLAPCPLFQKAQEQIKKVEEIKREEKEIRTEVEDWQTNLDNWKSSRRKRQEHIIERVVEVKKLTEQEEYEKSRRKSKTFSEMMEGRIKGRHKFNIPLYEDDSNDLSDYGIGSSSSKTNSIKDPDTDDSLLDEKGNHMFDLTSNKENSNTYNQSHNEDEANNTKNGTKIINNNNNSLITKTYSSVYSTNLNLSHPKSESLSKSLYETNTFSEPKDTKQYTYEGAIEDYRSRIQTINSDEFRNKEPAEILLPKGEIFKRKDIFEKQTVEIGSLASSSTRRLSDIGTVKSIKDRLKIFEQNNDQITKSDLNVFDKQKPQNITKPDDIDNANNIVNKTNINKISNYLVDRSNSGDFEKNGNRSFSPETELYVNKLNMFNRDLDNLMINKSLDENYTPSISSTELTCVSSDREDSGIHTGDISCSVSQADETADIDIEINSNINDKLNENTQFEDDLHKFQDDLQQLKPFNRKEMIENRNSNGNRVDVHDEKCNIEDTKEIKSITEEFLESSRSNVVPIQKPIDIKEEVGDKNLPIPKPKPVIYENVDIKKFNVPSVDFMTSDFVPFSDFNAPPIEPPKVKPPPPPADEKIVPDHVKRANLRSSFLGLEEPENRLNLSIEKPPDLTSFLRMEQKLEKSYERKFYENNSGGVLNKVESQDSGLDVERGRLSSDTWCSSVGDSSAASHEKQASELTNSNISEDEITKKEREIIELVEKEEQYRDIVEYRNKEPVTKAFKPKNPSIACEPSLGNQKFDNPCFDTQPSDFLDQDSEVLKVEQELRQLELEELERQRESLLFRETRAKAHLHNRHSMENLADQIYPPYSYENQVDCRKSMPELAIQKSSTLDYGHSVPVSHSYYGYENVRDLKSSNYVNHGHLVDGDLGIPVDYRKSMPNLQHAQKKSSTEHQRPPVEPSASPMEHRKSMPELVLDVHSPIRPRLIPPKPALVNERSRYEQHNIKSPTRHLGATHRSKHDKSIHPQVNNDGRNYNQHWLIQEAELRRLSDQRKNFAHNQVSRQQPIQCIPARPTMDKIQQPIPRSHRQPVNYALPSMSYSTPVVPKESHDKILSVSGKKKCSYCGNELGRGAAMIVESLCLFYHMDCFKCCVCHVQLGDGMMGTDVKVRNQKLHCHNCYSSDDGIKFSCV